MNYKDIQKKVVDMNEMLIALEELGRSREKFPDMADEIAKRSEQIRLTMIEALMFGIIAKDLMTELDKSESVNVAVHEIGYQHGINQEFFRRVKTVQKKISKLKG